MAKPALNDEFISIKYHPDEKNLPAFLLTLIFCFSSCSICVS